VQKNIGTKAVLSLFRFFAFPRGYESCYNDSFLFIIIARENFINKNRGITAHAGKVYLSTCLRRAGESATNALLNGLWLLLLNDHAGAGHDLVMPCFSTFEPEFVHLWIDMP
jgi:hypothetical protein